MNTSKQSLLLLVACVIALAAAPAYCASSGKGGGTSSTGGKGGGGSTTTPPPGGSTTTGGDPYVSQTGTIGSGNGFILDVNGSPANTDGHDHVYVPGVGVTYNYLPALPTGTNISYRTVTVNSVTTHIQQTTVAGTTTDSGPRYEQQSVSGTTKYVPIVPGAGVSMITKGELEGTTDGTLTGIIASGLHSGDQVAGGITNGLAKKYDSIEGLIDAVKKSADTYVDITKSQNFTSPDPSKFGDPDNGIYKFVYARGSKNSDGSINEEPDASGMGGLKFAGGFKGAGVLIVEVEDPDNAQLEFSGGSMWVGLVIVVANKNPTKNNAAPLVTVGGGNSIHLVGGAFVYMRNQEDSLINQNFTKLAGQADIKYSSAALNFLTQSVPASMEVRSWAKLPEE
jgi:hypothetical protein